MKVKREKTENCEAYLTVEVEPAVLEESLERAYLRLVKKYKIPGFRQGKAPRALLERYLGRERLLEDALNELIPEAYEQALKEEKLEAIARPQIEISQTEPLVFKARVPLKPSVELGDYHKIRVKPEPVKVTREDIEATIQRLQHEYATWEPVERPVELNDLVVLDVRGSLEDNVFLDQQGVQYQVLSGSSFPAPGFAEELVGLRIGEQKEFELELPSDYPRSELAGKRALFKVKILEIKQEKLPKLDIAFAKEIDPELKSVAGLRKKIAGALKAQAEVKARRAYEDRVVQAVVEKSKAEFPPILVEEEINRLLDEQLQRWQMRGGSVEEYLEKVKKTEAELREELYPLATSRVESSLVLGKVSEEEKIAVDDAEIEAEIKNVIETSDGDKEKLEKLFETPQARQSIWGMLATRKTLERLVAIAQGSGKSSGISPE